MKIRNLLKLLFGSKNGNRATRSVLKDLGLECKILLEKGKKDVVGLALAADIQKEGVYFLSAFMNAQRKKQARITIEGDQIHFRILGPEEKTVSFHKDQEMLAKLRALLIDKCLKKELEFNPIDLDFGAFHQGFQIVCKPEGSVSEAVPI